jgi:hypothetical protein
VNALAIALALAQASPLAPLEPARVDRIRVESGQIEPVTADTFVVRRPGMRAVVSGSLGSSASVTFTYLGPTRDEVPLASGELRRQIGLKLRSQDTCNIVYVMWHIAPRQGINVQVKSNPGLATHDECRDSGYQSVQATTKVEARPIRVGERRTLRAEIESRALRVYADDVPVWEGTLPMQVLAFDGPAGIRSDNGVFDVTMRTARGEPR